MHSEDFSVLYASMRRRYPLSALGRAAGFGLGLRILMTVSLTFARRFLKRQFVHLLPWRDSGRACSASSPAAVRSTEVRSTLTPSIGYFNWCGRGVRSAIGRSEM